MTAAPTGVDSLEHIFRCYGLTPLSAEDDPDTKVTTLHRLARRLSKNTPIVPIPECRECQNPEEGEISFASGDEISMPSSCSSSDGVSLVDPLEFEVDDAGSDGSRRGGEGGGLLASVGDSPNPSSPLTFLNTMRPAPPL